MVASRINKGWLRFMLSLRTAIQGVPVFSSAYQLVGLGWIFAATEWPILKHLIRWGYDMFAKYRTNVTRGSSLEDLVKLHNAKKADCASCEQNTV